MIRLNISKTRGELSTCWSNDENYFTSTRGEMPSGICGTATWDKNCSESAGMDRSESNEEEQ